MSREVIDMATPFSLWSARVLGILVSLFIGLFALDAFDGNTPFLQALPHFLIHLIPALVLLGLTLASFRWPWIGGAAFIGLAVWYAARMSRGRVDWIFTISLPLATVGVLFLWGWLRSVRSHA